MKWSNLDCAINLGQHEILILSACEQTSLSISSDCCSISVAVDATCATYSTRWEANYQGADDWSSVQQDNSDILLLANLPDTYKEDPNWQFRPVVTINDVTPCEIVGGWTQLDYLALVTSDECTITATLDDPTCEALVSEVQWELMTETSDTYFVLEETSKTITATKDGLYRAKIIMDNGCSRYSEPVAVMGCLECSEAGISIDLGADHYICFGRETRVDLNPIIIAPDDAIITWYVDVETTVIPVFPLYPYEQGQSSGLPGEYSYQYILEVSDVTQQCTVRDTVMVYISDELDVDVTPLSGSCGAPSSLVFSSIDQMDEIIEISIDGGLTYPYTLDMSLPNSQLDVNPGLYDVWVRYAEGGCRSRVGYVDAPAIPVDCSDLDCPKIVIDDIQVTIPPDCSDLSSGTLTVEVSGAGIVDSDVRYSVDRETFQVANLFTDLLPGEYIVYAKYEPTGCLDSMTVEIGVPECLYCEIVESINIDQPDFQELLLSLEGPLPIVFNTNANKTLEEQYKELISDFASIEYFLIDKEGTGELMDTISVNLTDLESYLTSYSQTKLLDEVLQHDLLVKSKFFLDEGIEVNDSTCRDNIKNFTCDDLGLDITICPKDDDNKVQVIDIELTSPFSSVDLIVVDESSNEIIDETIVYDGTYILLASSKGPFRITATSGDCTISTTAEITEVQEALILDIPSGACLTGTEILSLFACDLIERNYCLTWESTGDVTITEDPNNPEVPSQVCNGGSGTLTIKGVKDGKIVLDVELPTSTTETECHDGKDNDNDGLADCLDSDCTGLQPDINGDGIWDGCQTEETITSCSDGFDNDLDGLVDCKDPDCEAFRQDIGCDPDITFSFTHSSLDCNNTTVCFKAIITNNGSETVSISSFDFSFIYSNNQISQSNVTTMMDPSLNDIQVEEQTAGSLGRIRISSNQFDLSTAANTIAPGQTLDIAEFCFNQIELDFLEEETFCLQLSSTATDVEIWLGPESCSTTGPYPFSTDAGRDPRFCLAMVCNGPMTEDDPSTCGDGVDNDQDGLTDCEDPDCNPGNELTISISLDRHSICDGETGQISVMIEGGNLADYNICFGDRCVDKETGVLNGLGAGDYNLQVTTVQGCDVVYTISPEICGNGIDDDGDGYDNCDDFDCLIENSGSFSTKESVEKSDECITTSIEEDICLAENKELLDSYSFDAESALLACEIIRRTSEPLLFDDFECTTRDDFFDENGTYLYSEENGTGKIKIVIGGTARNYSDNQNVLTADAHGEIMKHYIAEVCPADIAGDCNAVEGLGFDQWLSGMMEVQSLTGVTTTMMGKKCHENIGITIAVWGPPGNVHTVSLQEIDSYKSVLIHELNHLFGQYDMASGDACNSNVRFQNSDHVIIYINQINSPYWNCVADDLKPNFYFAMVSNYKAILNRELKKFILENFMLQIGDLEFWSQYGL